MVRYSLANLRNLGPVSAEQLAEIGILNEEGLRAVGVVVAFTRIRFRFGNQTSLNMLWALEGALTDIDWRKIPPSRKEQLKKAVGVT